MPARVIDGEAMWGSDKLFQCPEDARVDYAWLYPLADAYGNFEMTNLRVVHGRVAAIRPNFTLALLEDRFRVYNEKGLLFIWETVGKKYGHWVGSEKPGRLPSKADKHKYRNCINEMPHQELQEYVARTTSGQPHDNSTRLSNTVLVLDKVLDRVLVLDEAPSSFLKSSESEQESSDMRRATKQIPLLCRSILHVKPDDYESNMAEIKQLGQAYDQERVISAFEDWANDNVGETFNGYPLAAFLKVADGIVSGTIQVTRNPTQDGLIDSLVYIANGAVTFDQQQARQVAKLLSEASVEEVVSAFRVYYSRIESDPIGVRLAAKKFPEQAGQIIRLERRNRQETAAQQELITTIGEQLSTKALAELDRLDKEKQAEEELAEETL